jgi:Peptidase family M1 domain
MSKIICVITVLSLLCQLVLAQDLYMPRNIKQAYKKGTRAADGRPGKNYFQNRASYNITLDAMPPARTIKGSAQIVYTNNSPDTLTYLVLRTIQNIHKPGALRYADVSRDYLTEGMIIDELLVNGETKNPGRNTPGTWKMVKLSTPLQPKGSINLSVKWHYDVSLESAREGMLDSTTFFMAYAYPSICVYDDYYSWDMMEFTDLQEFYYDFNDYTVTVNVPQHYIVWGTGDLLNAGEVLRPEYVQRLKKAARADEVISIVSAEDLKSKNITAANAVNSWKFKATNIQDVAYAVSDHFVWDGSSVVVDDKTGRRATVHAAYRSSTADFKKMAGWCNYSLRWFSKELPGVPYPFPKMTVVEGYADMEFPMMVNGIAHSDSMLTRRIGAEHEVAHSWFPFYMGINESRYAFMDEGWASFMEASIAYAYRPKDAVLAGDAQDAGAWSETPLDEVDLPIITPSNMLNGQAYQLNSYTKPMMAYRAAKDLLGDVLFKKCLHGYMQRWNGKHPTPWDFFYTFNNIAGKNLNYFWKGWFFDNSHIDYAIGKVSTTASGITVAIKNAGGTPAPFDLLITYADGSTETIHQTPAVWASGKTVAVVSIKTKLKVKMVEINGGVFVDADAANNTWKAK